MRWLTLGAMAAGLFSAVLLGVDPRVVDQASAGETDRLERSSEIFILNTTGLSVDVYVNYERSPTISDPKPLVGDFANKDELSPTVFVVDGTGSRPYGTYTFSVRPKGNPDGEVLASASIVLEQGRSFTGAFQPRAGGGHRFAIYENDLSPASSARLTVRNASGRPVTWRIAPNGEAPTVPHDERSGALADGEWQIARDVVDNDYRIEFFVDGRLAATHPDVDIAVGKNHVVWVMGNVVTEDPGPGADKDLYQRPVVYEELEFDPGPVDPRGVSAPAPPLSAADTNAPVEFSCGPVEIWETTEASAAISAVDPDGMVTNLSIDGVEPKAGGIEIPSASVRPSSAIGEPASAVVRFKDDIPAGEYVVTVAANRGSLAHQAVCALEVTVRPITVARLGDQVQRFEATRDVAPPVADKLDVTLRDAQRHLGAGDVEGVCRERKEFDSEIGSEKGKAVSDMAADRLSAQAKAFGNRFDCG